MAGRALCVGINRFKDRDINALRGCVNDARNVARVLSEEYGFEDVRTLLDAQATKAAYLENLDWLVSSAKPGDVVVLFTSSHGSHVPDASGDEADGEDEVVVVHDHDWETTVLIDDELEQHFHRVPQGATLITLWDTCHSGSLNDDSVVAEAARRARAIATKGLAGGGRPDVVSKYLKPPPHLSRATRGVRRGVISGRGLADVARRASASTAADGHGHLMSTLALAACNDDETAADAAFGGVYAGAFTHNLLAALTAHEGDLSWQDLFTRATHSLRAAEFEQTPQLHGAADLKTALAFGGSRGRRSSAGVAPGAPAGALAAIDREITAAESQGRWADAAVALQKRVAAVPSLDEKLRTLEHLAGLCRVKLRDEADATLVAERIVALAPTHAGATQYLRERYTLAGDHAKLQALARPGQRAVAPQHAPQAPQGPSLLSQIGGGLGAAVTAVGAAVAAAPATWMQPTAQPAQPAQSARATPRCPYCGTDLAAGARQCPQCGGEL